MWIPVSGIYGSLCGSESYECISEKGNARNTGTGEEDSGCMITFERGETTDDSKVL